VLTPTPALIARQFNHEALLSSDNRLTVPVVILQV
jgi:hypothetical protein